MAGTSSSRRSSPRSAVVTEYVGMVLVVALLIAIFGLTAPNFFQVETFRMTANQIPEAIVLAVGMTYVLIIAGIDLSVGSVLALSSAVLGVCLVRYQLPLPVAIAASLATGLACGAVNGSLTVAWRLPSFIVTLGMLQAARGLTHIVTGQQTQYFRPMIRELTSISVLGLSLPFLIAVVIALLGQIVLCRTVFGRYMVAIGTNEEAARLSGIDPRRIKLVVFTLCGLLAAVAALAQTTRLGSATPTAGTGFELEVIAAVVIGGTSLMGGRGTVIRSVFGVIIIAILGRGLIQLGAADPTKQLITGCVIVAAVIVDHYRHRFRKAPLPAEIPSPNL